MKRIKYLTKGPLILGLSLLLASGVASAFPCSEGYVDGNKTDTPLTNPNGTGDDFACLDGPAGDKNDSSADLNAGTGFFGFNDWTFYDKIDTPDSDNIGSNGLLQITNLVTTAGGDIVAGNWNFIDPNSTFWTSFTDALIVIKDGNADGNIFWSAYLVNFGELDGNWSMPTRNLSHIDLYTRAGLNPPPPPPEPVPEPATLFLLGAGLLGLIAKSRRKYA